MYEKRQNRWMKHLDFFILDVLSIELLYFVLLHLLIISRSRHIRTSYQQMYFVLPVVMLCMFIVHDFYKSILKRDFWTELLSTIELSSFLSIATLAFLFLTKNINGYSRKFFLLFWLFGWAILPYIRTLCKWIVRSRYNATQNMTHLAFVTDKPFTEELLQSIRAADLKYSLDAVFCDSEYAGDIAHPLNISEMEEYRNGAAIDEVLLDIADNNKESKWTQYLISSGVPIHIRMDSSFKHLPNASVDTLGDMTVITSSQSVAYSGQLLLKRIMDIIGSLVGLLITFIAWVIFAPVIKIQSPGPVFYSQTRIGKNGRQFTIYKFRSMYPNADELKKELMKENKMSGHMFKMENDPRIIPIGHFMRKHSIDELPQFLNVLKGDMALVGTRPPTLDEWKKYSAHHRARVSAKPGLTGMWQVSGRSDVTNFEDVVAMDVDYIEHWSIWLDIKLIFKTVYVVLFGKGAE